MKLGIVGLGVVGGTLLKYFQEQQRDVVTYDTKGVGSLEGIAEADQIYVCVPTPSKEDGSCDTSIVEEVVANVNKVKEGYKIVVVKSTIIPGTTERLQAQYPDLALIYNPEFLTQATAIQDMFYPERQILGYTLNSFGRVLEVIQQLPRAPFERFIPATVAEMTKYFCNTLYATKVVFANQIYDLCQKLGIDYDSVKECATTNNEYSGINHWDVLHKGYRGYGGSCLPKDSKALIALGDLLGVNLEVLKMVNKVNEDLLKQHG